MERNTVSSNALTTHKSSIDLGTFTVDAKMLPNGNFDVYIGHEGCSGDHYPEVTASRIGELVMDLIECVAEGY